MRRSILFVCAMMPITMATFSYNIISSLMGGTRVTSTIGPAVAPTENMALVTFILALIGGGISLTLGWYAGAYRSREELVVKELGSIAHLALRRKVPNLTLKDLELMLCMKKLKQFTIKEIAEKTGLSRQAVWKLASKLEEQKVTLRQGRSRRDSEGIRGVPPISYVFAEQL